MKKIITTIPTFVFLLLVTLPISSLLLGKYFQEYDPSQYQLVFKTIQTITLWAWTCSLVHYFSSEASNFKYTNLLYIIITLEAIFFHSDQLYLLTILFLAHVLSIVIIAKKVKNVFYARSLWFIFVELIFIILGMITLTPEIKRWEKDKTKLTSS